MLRRASDLAARARERIRAAREHDPHAWPERDNDRGPLHDDEPIDVVESRTTTSGRGPRRGRRGDDAPGDGGRRDPAPAGQPRARRPRPRRRRRPRRGQRPTAGGRPRRPGERDAAACRRRTAAAAPEDERPERAADRRAAWSWRLIVVLVGLYVLLYAAAYVAVVVVPVIVALLLAALLQPGAAGLVRRGWPASLAAFTMLLVGLAVVAGIITLVVERFRAGFDDLANQVSEGIGQVQTFVVRTFPITRGQLDDAVTQLQQTPGRQPGHARLGRAHHGRHRGRGDHRHPAGPVHAVLLPQGRPLDLAVAGRPVPRRLAGLHRRGGPPRPGGR